MSRPERIASLTLYEPSAFHLLRTMGPAGATALAEISELGRVARAGVTSGDCATAAAVFVDYWSSPGTWAAMKDDAKAAVLRWFPKLPLEFQAAFGVRTPFAAYRHLPCPVLILQGERAREPSRLIAERLAKIFRHGRLAVVAGAGHMGPFTHLAEVNALIAAHIAGCDAESTVAA